MDLLDNHEKESTNFINEIIEFLNKDILLNEIIFIAFKIVCIFLLTVLILIILKKVFSKLYRKDSFNNFRLSFIKKMIRGFIIFLGIMLSFYQIPVFKSVVVTLFASSGILALVIGFASQEAFSNIVSGIFIILFRPFKKGDIVKLISNNIIGSVEDITLRHTIIKTYENKRVIVPNTAINKEVIENADMIDKKTCRFFEVGISYDSDIDLAISIIKDENIKTPELF
jgi:small conductance mechanosensitive channel